MTFNKYSTLGKIQELMRQRKDESEITKILRIPKWKVKRHMNVINSVSQKDEYVDIPNVWIVTKIRNL